MTVARKRSAYGSHARWEVSPLGIGAVSIIVQSKPSGDVAGVAVGAAVREQRLVAAGRVVVPLVPQHVVERHAVRVDGDVVVLRPEPLVEADARRLPLDAVGRSRVVVEPQLVHQLERA